MCVCEHVSLCVSGSSQCIIRLFTRGWGVGVSGKGWEGGGGDHLYRGASHPFQDSSSCIGVHLTLNSHLWLQEAVTCDSGHTPVNCLDWRAKPGEGSWLGLKASGEPDRGLLPKHAKTGPGGVSEENDLVPTVM